MRFHFVLLFLSCLACGGGTTPRGTVALGQLCGGGACRSTAVAIFVEQTSSDCAVTSAGSCRLLDCRSTSPDAAPRQLSAGTLKVAGPRGRLLELEHMRGGYGVVEDLQPWSAGHELTITATGATVPRFSAKVVAPGESSLVAPACDTSRPYGACGTFSRSSDLVVRWDGPTGAELRLNGRSPGRLAAIFCDADSSPASVPAALLRRLDLGEVVFGFTPQNRVTLPAGDWDVAVSASNTAGTRFGVLLLDD